MEFRTRVSQPTLPDRGTGVLTPLYRSPFRTSDDIPKVYSTIKNTTEKLDKLSAPAAQVLVTVSSTFPLRI